MVSLETPLRLGLRGFLIFGTYFVLYGTTTNHLFNLNPLIMKKLYLFCAFLVIGLSVKAVPSTMENELRRDYGDAFIFTERDVEFAIFPDGQFDFFYNPRRGGSGFSLSSPNVNISFNAGYNYDPFVQYDDFGAVIQIENVPIYYDYYGRIIQAGRVHINYNHFGMVNRIGNLHLHYNPYNHYTHYTGYINRYNPYYVYRPWHNYYMRPHVQSVIVYHQPYRAYYHPNRIKYSQYKRYYKKNYNDNFRRSYYRPGERVASYHRGRRVDSPREIRSNATAERRAASINRSNATSTRDQAVYQRNQTRRQINTDRREVRRTQSTTRKENAIQTSRRTVQAQRNEAPVRHRVERNVRQERKAPATVNKREVRRERRETARASRPSTPSRTVRAPQARPPENTPARSSRSRGGRQ